MASWSSCSFTPCRHTSRCAAACLRPKWNVKVRVVAVVVMRFRPCAVQRAVRAREGMGLGDSVLVAPILGRPRARGHGGTAGKIAPSFQGAVHARAGLGLGSQMEFLSLGRPRARAWERKAPDVCPGRDCYLRVFCARSISTSLAKYCEQLMLRSIAFFLALFTKLGRMDIDRVTIFFEGSIFVFIRWDNPPRIESMQA